MKHKRDYYDVLGVNRAATPEEIKRAYRKLARELHPDINKAEDAETRFNEVNEAYEVLSEPNKRSKFDQFGHAGSRSNNPYADGHRNTGGAQDAHYTWSNIGGRPGPGAGNVGADDMGAIFEEIFGSQPHDSPFANAQRPAPRQRATPRELKHDLTITFMTAVTGGTEQVHLTTGGANTTIDVIIPAGVTDGQKLRMRKAARGADLIVTVSIGKHPHFYRDAARALDLLIDVPISITEAALGATVTVPLLKGSVELTIPPGTASSTRLRIKGHGIKAKSGKAGDLFAVVKIIPPTKPGKKSREHLDALAKLLENPRKGSPWEN